MALVCLAETDMLYIRYDEGLFAIDFAAKTVHNRNNGCKYLQSQTSINMGLSNLLIAGQNIRRMIDDDIKQGHLRLIWVVSSFELNRGGMTLFYLMKSLRSILGD